MSAEPNYTLTIDMGEWENDDERWTPDNVKPAEKADEDGIVHGTNAGAQKERKLHGWCCLRCSAAASAYQRQWRATKGKDKARRLQLGTGRALQRLRQQFPAEFEAFYLEELQKIDEAGGSE